MHSYFQSVFAAVVCLALASCIPEVQPDTVSLIHTGPGPEDLVHDNFDGRNRLLISCNDRSEGGTYGEIEAFNVDSPDTAAFILPRTGHPADVPFHPHGIAIAEREGAVYLYAVNHYENEAETSSVIVYRVEDDQLVFIKEFRDELIETPNGIAARTNGGFYITNDGAGTSEALQEFLVNNFNGSVVYCPFEGACTEIAGQLSYPNGIYQLEEDLFVATSAHKALFRYDLPQVDEAVNREKLSGGIGLDNIRTKDDWLIIAQHIDLVAFLLHSTNPQIQSPFKVLAVNRYSGEQRVLFYSNGYTMSGASTGLIVGDDLYIGQVFGPYLLKVSGVDL